MKKILALMLAAALALSLVACGGGSGAGDNNSTNTPSGGNAAQTKEEMLESADTVNIIDIYKSAKSNKVNAAETYTGNVYTIAGSVKTIENDHIELYNSSMDGNFTTRVYMGTDDIKLLNTGDSIEVVGIISAIDFLEEKEGDDLYYTIYTSGIELSPAYFVTDTFEITGKLVPIFVDGTENTVIDHWTLELDNSANSASIISLNQTFSLEEVTTSSIKEKEFATICGTDVKAHSTVTISCKISHNRVLQDIISVTTN